MVMLDGISDGICFDIEGKLGDVFQLIYDPIHGNSANTVFNVWICFIRILTIPSHAISAPIP